MPVALIILAAGLGTRMNSEIPKLLHPLGGAPLLAHALRAGAAVEPERIIVVTGHGAEAVAAAARAADDRVEIVVQGEQLGTGHAVAQAMPALKGFSGRVVVLLGDTPFIGPETLAALAESPADVTALGFTPADPARYGRMVMAGESLERIVEFNDASPEERAISLCNGGMIAADADILARLVAGLGRDNAAGEYYLTDIIAAARAEGLSTAVTHCAEAETLGINTRADLARAEALFQARARAEALENGVTLLAPETVFFALDTHIGRDTIIAQNVVFGPGVSIESGAVIHAFCHLEGCHIAAGASVGPFARLRPGTELAEDVHVGNFVEIKNSVLDEGVKVGHLSYLGDAHVGQHANIGAGTVTCNYDGVLKHRTEIGARSFIGSATMLVAPVKVGKGAMTGSGSVITRDVPDGALALTRAEQQTRPGFVARFLEARRARKAKMKKDV